MVLFFQVFVLNIFSECLLLCLGLLHFFAVFFLHSIDHVVELLDVCIVSSFHLIPLSHKLVFEDWDIPTELLLKSSHSGSLHRHQSFYMDKMVPDSNLILVFCFIKILIKHLNEGLFGIQFSLVVLRVNVNLIFEFFSFGDSHDFPPIGEKFLLVEVDNFVFTFNLGP